MARVATLIEQSQAEAAVVEALRWRSEDEGDVLALVALGNALKASGRPLLAARAYGSIVDLFPSRADMRRYAGALLESLGEAGQGLAADSFAEAVLQRPDHPNSHRTLAYAMLRLGEVAGAFAVIEAGLRRGYPEGRFLGVERILREDLALIGEAWLAREPARRISIEERLRAAGASRETQPSLRFVLSWETDANDVDFHIHDGQGGHAYYGAKVLSSGGELYADVTTGYGPECFTIPGKFRAFPYKLRIHYYSRGPMGYGMGKLEIIQHDGRGGLRFEQRPYVVMNDRAFVDLGTIEKPL
jgi:tetratricopeptide (TPR) repeat protein